jgi:hypothetical protein
MATNWIPIIFAGVGDPVGLGLTQSFARSGGNITGEPRRHLVAKRYGMSVNGQAKAMWEATESKGAR